MNKILTFDCYGTLLNTDVLYEYVYNLAKKNGISGNKAREIFINYEDRLMYGEDFIPYDQLLFNVLEYCDMEFNTDIFSSKRFNVFKRWKLKEQIKCAEEIQHELERIYG